MRRADRDVTSRERINEIMLHYSGRQWEFDGSTLNRTRVWRVAIDELTGKQSSLMAP
jgi:hypothetical protein